MYINALICLMCSLLRKQPNRGMGSKFCTVTLLTAYILCCCELTVSVKVKLKMGKGKEWDKFSNTCIHYLFTLTFVYSQLTTTQRNVGG